MLIVEVSIMTLSAGSWSNVVNVLLHFLTFLMNTVVGVWMFLLDFNSVYYQSLYWSRECWFSENLLWKASKIIVQLLFVLGHRLLEHMGSLFRNLTKKRRSVHFNSQLLARKVWKTFSEYISFDDTSADRINNCLWTFHYPIEINNCNTVDKVEKKSYWTGSTFTFIRFILHMFHLYINLLH